jgi:hypothetical protein
VAVLQKLDVHLQATNARNIKLVNGGLLLTGVLSSYALFMFANCQEFLGKIKNKMLLPVICMFQDNT